MDEQGHQPTEGQATPELLYHYTTENGLYGILKSDCIWTTHYRFLNDLSECLEAPELFEAKTTQISSVRVPQSDQTKAVRQAYWRNIRDTLRAQIESADAYFVSFTDESNSWMPGDRLTLWRGYGEKGQGFSLEFCRSKLQQRTRSFEQQLQRPIQPMKCLYGETQESRLKREAIISMLVGFANSQILEQTLQWSAQFKNRGFYEEREWRFVLQMSVTEGNSGLIEFHDGRFGKTPHIAIPLALKDQDSPLKRIVVGPAPDKEQAAARLRIELVQMGIQGVEVVSSKIPYRNW
jgi:hypothetical protein